DIYLAELARRDGCADASPMLCPRCKDPGKVPMYHCEECAGRLLLCRECCLEKHLENPLHEWTGIYFNKTSVKDLGLCIQFSHPPGEHCYNSDTGHQDFVVVHDNGIHKVNVTFCGPCSRVPYIQLLRAGWYPATEDKPHTCATFLVLNKLHLCSLQAKMTTYDFYAVLAQLTNNTGVKPP
ncbi:hypothetical protein B0H10DRAFT_1638328, partial [Mycena sp. CBHHK59/15]